MKIGNREFDLSGSAYVCGILNVTPDSFSDGGSYNNVDAALFHTEEMLRDGAAIIDIGGESTRPGYTQISEEEEIERVCPVIEAIKKRFDIPISLDTYKWRVAKTGIESGADMINDIWGGNYADDGKMVKLLANTGIPCCLMHNRKFNVYNHFMTDYLSDINSIMKLAISNGIKTENIILDPGVGFAKDYNQNLLVINRIDELKKLGFPVLLGVSRKSVIGLTLDLPKDERLEGTIAANVIGLMKGASIFRVHDVKENYRALKMSAAIMGTEFDK